MQQTTQRGTTQRGSKRAGGFSLLEILVVVSIMAALMAISVAVYANLMEAARRTATLVTISKADKLLQQQISAWSKEFRDSIEIKQTSQHPVITNLVSGQHAQEALALKFYFQRHFPQNVTEAAGFDGVAGTSDDVAAFQQWLKPEAMGGNKVSPADSAELLYLILTEGKVRGAAPVDSDSFTGRELADTDEDGFLELVDGWGNPLRFYRWPTRLLNPFGFVADGLATGVNNSVMALDLNDASGFQSVQMSLGAGNFHVVVGREIMRVTNVSGSTLTVERGSQSTTPEIHPAGAIVRLAAFADIVSLVFGSLNSSAVAHDTDDPRGALLDSVGAEADPVAAAAAFEDSFHTLDSFQTPLIVSAGTDGDLGLFEPDDTGNFGHLAAPDTSTNFDIILNPGSSTLNDNLTNQMEGLGN